MGKCAASSGISPISDHSSPNRELCIKVQFLIGRPFISKFQSKTMLSLVVVFSARTVLTLMIISFALLGELAAQNLNDERRVSNMSPSFFSAASLRSFQDPFQKVLPLEARVQMESELLPDFYTNRSVAQIGTALRLILANQSDAAQQIFNNFTRAILLQKLHLMGQLIARLNNTSAKENAQTFLQNVLLNDQLTVGGKCEAFYGFVNSTTDQQLRAEMKESEMEVDQLIQRGQANGLIATADGGNESWCALVEQILQLENQMLRPSGQDSSGASVLGLLFSRFRF